MKKKFKFVENWVKIAVICVIAIICIIVAIVSQFKQHASGSTSSWDYTGIRHSNEIQFPAFAKQGIYSTTPDFQEYELFNDNIVIRFRYGKSTSTDQYNTHYVQKLTAVKKDGVLYSTETYQDGLGWLCLYSTGRSPMSLTNLSNQINVEDGKYNFLIRFRGVDKDLNGKSSEFDTVNAFDAGFPSWIIPNQISVEKENEGTTNERIRKVTLNGENAFAKMQVSYILGTNDKEPTVVVSACPKQEGYYSFGMFYSNKEINRNNVKFIELPYRYTEQNLPEYPVLVTENYSTSATSQVTYTDTSKNRDITYGITVAPSSIENRWVYTSSALYDTQNADTIKSQANFGLTIVGKGLGVQPGLFAPVMTSEDSRVAANETGKWKQGVWKEVIRYKPTNTVSEVSADSWYENYEHVLNDILEVKDYRKNYYASMTDTIFNLYKLLKDGISEDGTTETDGTYSAWSVDGKANYSMEGRNIVELTDGLEYLQMYLLTEDPTIYKFRTIPTLEYLLSRNNAKTAMGNVGITGVKGQEGYIAGSKPAFTNIFTNNGEPFYNGMRVNSTNNNKLYRGMGLTETGEASRTSSTGNSTYTGIYMMTQGLNPEFRRISANSLLGTYISQADKLNIKNPSESMWKYKTTGNIVDLQNAISYADKYVTKRVYGNVYADYGAKIVDSDFINTKYYPNFNCLLEMYEIINNMTDAEYAKLNISGKTKQEKAREYLLAARESARRLITTLWSTSTPQDGETVKIVNTLIYANGIQAPNMRIASVQDLYYHGDTQNRLGYGTDLLTLKSAATARVRASDNTTVEAWIVSRNGLGLEQHTTFGGSKNVIMSTFAPDLMRLAQALDEEVGNGAGEIFETYARNSLVGRFANYPGYYIGEYNTYTKLADFPYVGPDTTNMYYHHIPALLATLEDFLFSQSYNWSNGLIDFENTRAQGAAWFSNRHYGYTSGKVFEETDMYLWLKEKLLTIEGSNPNGNYGDETKQIDWYAARKDGRVAFVLMNESDSDITKKITFSTELGVNGNATIYSANGSKTTKAISSRSVTVTIPAKSVIAIAMNASKVTKPSYITNDIENIEYSGKTTSLGNTVDHYNLIPDSTGQVPATKTSGTYDVNSFIIQVNPNDYYFYVYSDRSPLSFKYNNNTYPNADGIKEMRLVYRIGSGAWTTLIDTTYPFEFSVPVDDVTKSVSYRVIFKYNNDTDYKDPDSSPRTLSPYKIETREISLQKGNEYNLTSLSNNIISKNIKENNSVITLDGNKVKALNAGTATLTVADSNQTYILNVNVGQEPTQPVTNLAVSTAGIVTWTDNVNPLTTKYQISFDGGTTWTTTISGNNHLSKIVGSTGTKTISVKAINNGSTSTIVSKNVTVVALTTNSNNTNYGTVDSATTNVISGVTYETSGNSLIVKAGSTTLKTILATPKDAAGYTTTFSSWSSASGTISSNKTVTATFTRTVNELTFNGGTLASGTYGTAYTSEAFAEPTNGSGNYTYTIVSGAPTGATINRTNRTISFTNSTDAGTYDVVVKAKDNVTSQEKRATFSILINPQTVNPVTNLSISTEGIVSWNESNNATGYEISLNGSTWESATSGINYLSKITASAGTKTVYVRAINSNNTNYVTPSDNATKTVTVYTVTLTKGTGISAVSGAGKYIKGSTVEISATVKDGYAWSKWTKTSGGTQISTNNQYSATINGNWSYKANAVANGLTFEGATLTSGIYGTEYTSEAFTAATNGSGNYTYTIESGAPDGATIDGTARTITFTDETPAGTYDVIVKAKDNTTNIERTATFRIVINQQTVNPVTNLNVSTAGKVTWNASSNATGYEISINEGSWESTTSNTVNYLTKITEQTGERVIRVRAINSDTSNFASPSTEESKTVTVVTLTIAKNDDSYGLINVPSYKVISGATYTTSNNKLTVKSGSTTLKTITATPKAETGYSTAFSNWSSTSGTITTDTTVTANFTRTASSLTFEGATLASGTYGTAYTSEVFTGATNGSGNYEYTIEGGAPEGATIDQANRTISFTNETSAGTYDVIVKVRDTVTSEEKNAIFRIVINQQTVNPVTNLNVNTAGIVTWDASSNATGYEISINGTTWTSATSGVNYLSKIISSTGSRTVRVRAINSDTTNYTSPSVEETKAVTVVTLTIARNNTSYGTVSASSYKVISGATYTTSSNKLTVKGITTGTATKNLKTITATPKAETGYSTSFSDWSSTSGTITANTTVTANFTRIASSLVFDGATLSEGVYGTDYTSEAFTEATNGSGNYTYTIVSGAPTGATLDETARTISFTNSTPAGTYDVVVKASDTVTGEEKDATYRIVINQQAVNPVTNLNINTAGIITWDASDNATGYEISIDGTTWESVASGVNYLNKIISSTGSKTVRIRAINSDTANYTSPSAETTKTIKVVTLTINSSNTNYGTVNLTTCRVISGTKYTTSNNILTVKSGSTVLETITATSKEVTGYTTTFSGWTPTSGTIKANTIVTATFTRTANELVFEGATFASGTYGSAYTSATFTAASGGSGNYTYTIESGAPDGATIDGTNGANRRIKFTATTGAGTYDVIVKAKDRVTGAEKTATFRIVINKQEVAPVTNLAVTTAGKVTWEASDNATGYEISLNGTDWEDATSGMNYLNKITATAGSRTIRVRAINSDLENYDISNSEVTKTVTVLTLTIVNNNSDYGSVNVSSYKVISGAKYTTNNNKLTVKGGSTTLKTVTATPIDITGYTTILSNWSPASGTITSDTTVTATFERMANDLIFNSATFEPGTYGTAYVSAAFKGASNGSGDYAYTIESGAPDGATLDGTTRKIRFTDTTPVGVYDVVVKAKDNITDAETTATFRIVINSQEIVLEPVNPVTNLNVSTSGIVSWTNSSNATGYEISIDGTNWIEATSGVNYLSTIINSDGNKTIRVRAINTNTERYITPSTEETKAITVYTLTTNSNDEAYGTVNISSYNVISGVTFESRNNILVVKGGNTTLKSVTATPIEATGYTTEFGEWSPASGTITANLNVTANFIRTANEYEAIYEYDGATSGNSAVSKTVTYNSNYGTLATPEKEYTITYEYNGATGQNDVSNSISTFAFDGWYKEATFANKVESTTKVTTARAHKLYAKWVNQTLIALPNPTKDGYTFDGWYKDNSLTQLVGKNNYMPTSSGTLYAKWTKNAVEPSPSPVVPSPSVSPSPVIPTPVIPSPSVSPSPVTPTPVVPSPSVSPSPVVPSPVVPTPSVNPSPVVPTPVIPSIIPISEEIVYSQKYKINKEEKYILNVLPKTTVSEYRKNIITNVTYKIYDKNGNEVVDEETIITTDMKFKTPRNEYTLIVLGDITKDGKISITDVVRANLFCVHITTPTTLEFLAADINSDEKISITDVVRINLASINIKPIG